VFAQTGPWLEGEINADLFEAVLGHSRASGAARMLLATLAAVADDEGVVAGVATDDSRWVLEVKWDGIRAQVRVDRGRLTLRTRPGRNAASEFPELGELGERLCARRVVFDAELVWPGCDGHLDFGAIAARLGRRRRVVALSFDRRSTCCSPFFAVLPGSKPGIRIRLSGSRPRCATRARRLSTATRPSDVNAQRGARGRSRGCDLRAARPRALGA